MWYSYVDKSIIMCYYYSEGLEEHISQHASSCMSLRYPTLRILTRTNLHSLSSCSKQGECVMENTFQLFKKNFINLVSLAIIGLSIVFGFTYNTTHINGNSMEPSFSSGDVILIEKDTDSLEAGDVIAMNGDKHAEQSGVSVPNMLKRIVGEPGDAIKMEDNILYINGEKEDAYKYTREPMEDNVDFELVLGEDFFFVMGDNRNFSSDSRDFGPVHRSSIVGTYKSTIRHGK